MGLSLGSFIAKIRPEDKKIKKWNAWEWISPVRKVIVGRLVHGPSVRFGQEQNDFDDHFKADFFLLIEVRKDIFAVLLRSAIFHILGFLIFYHKSKLYVEIYVWKFAIGINLGGVI